MQNRIDSESSGRRRWRGQVSGIVHGAALLWVALWLAGCAMGFNPQRIPEAVEIPIEGVKVPIEVVHNLAFVPVRVNGSEPLWFLIDTGAFAVIIDDDAATRIGLRRSVRYGRHVTSAGEYVGRMDLGSFETLQVGAATFGDFEGLVSDLSQLAKVVEHPFDGVIGIPLMHSSVWTIDYAHKELRLAQEMPELADDAAAMPFTFRDGAPVMDICVGDQILSAEIDTGNTGGLDLSEEDGKRVPLINDELKFRNKHRTLSGVVWQEWVRVDGMVTIGPLKFDRPLANLARETMFGCELLQGCVFTIDCAQQLVRIEQVEKD